ncbi:AAA family ATPase [Kocuria rosea]|uniref:AAA family ATPase n=1 Tax=Kocuria rosea TaxID=1275 RepID=UPI000DF8D237|nr:AAA family ATPase [Kocuria rosea]STX02587.1 Uncharacterised protein [Kocuria rosea]
MTSYAEATAPDPLDGAFSGSWLMEQTFPPTRYVVDGVIPEGFSMLVAAPKIGKSWLVLGLAVATATGGRAFGAIPVQPAPVLYLALEDGQKRLQRRLRHMGVSELPSNVHFLTELAAGVLPTIEAFLERHADEAPLVILDTLGKIMPPARMGQSAYSADYAISGGLRDLTGRYPGSALIAVHHTRKAAAEDFTQTSSGTQGLTGGADTILVLSRSRQEGAGTLAITSRDAEENEYSIAFNAAAGQWTLDGHSLVEAAESARRLRSTEGVGDGMTEVIEIINRHPGGIRRKDIESLTSIKPTTVGSHLSRAEEAGRITKYGRGLYGPATTATTATSNLLGPSGTETAVEASATDCEEGCPDIALVAHVAPSHGPTGRLCPVHDTGMFGGRCFQCDRDAPEGGR